ncbi:MAG TPA: DUF5947 family protein [Thermoleophilaceae bacterium]
MSSQRTADTVRARRAAGGVAGLRRLRETPGRVEAVPRTGERCDLCGTDIPEDHRHLLQLEERRIDCACETCFAMRSGDPEYRPTGTRVVWLDGLVLSDELWASFQIPIGLAFLMRSSSADRVVALYPSPAGATECELYLESWNRLCADNPVLDGLETDGEGLIVNRLADPPQYAIAPIDECYRLVGIVKMSWEGISGGAGLERAIAGFFDELRKRATAT